MKNRKKNPQKKEKKILFFILLCLKSFKSVFIFLIEGLRVFDPEKKTFFFVGCFGVQIIKNIFCFFRNLDFVLFWFKAVYISL